ncbi:Antiseptic resistance protein [Actinomadura rubteroloni]|uniref:Antiseptic resistance protein n=1 Tax=Actinomadura rubteroloni TaxID=1926885 RepID=A0A2P4UFD0_9ACTN|nr:MFS transporter [Actinomadura rubteroloni]POM23718.1 Antiseptic resistance protein [Actinomadura rubteroloni]
MTVNAVRKSAPPVPGPGRARLMPTLMSACVVLVVAMVAATNLALPDLARSDLHPSGSQLLWIVDTYVLVFGCLLIPAGAIGDRRGRKGALLAGLAAFAAGCLVSALAPGVTVMLAGRLVTGAGAALIMPATLSLLLQVTEPARRPQAIAGWTAATGVAGAVGNVGGGAILRWLPWQGLFYVGAPAALLLAAAVAWAAPRGERHDADLDVTGAALLTLGLFALLFGIIEGPGHGWSSGVVLGGFACAAVLLAVFTVHALRAAHPLLDPRIFAVARLRGGVVGVGAVFFGLFALFFVNAQYLQYAKGYDTLKTGVAIVPLILGMIVVSRRSVALAARWGERTVVAAGLACVGAGLLLLSFADAATPYPWYAAFLLLLSCGTGLCLPTLSVGVMTSLPHGRAGLGSGLNGAAREIGSALGVAVAGTVLAARLAAGLPPGERARSAGEALAHAAPGLHDQVVGAFTDGMSAGLRVVGVVVLASAVLAVAGRRP